MAGLFLIMALAGCLGGDEADPEGQNDGIPETAGEAEFSDDTGALRGAVSSDLFEPLQSARVEVLDMDRNPTEYNATTAANGEFVISHMEPGQYIVFVTRVGYEANQRSAQINAGELTQIQVQLEPLPGDGPFTEEWEEAAVISESAAWRVEPPVVGCILVPMTGGAGSSCGNIRFGEGNFNMQITEEVKTIIVEMVWSPAGPLGEFLRLELICPQVPRGSVGGAVEDKEHPCYFDSPSTVSPVIHRIDEEHWLEHDYNQTGSWDGRVFSGYGMLGTYDLIGVDAGVAYEQSFEVFITLFHREAAPEGYTRIPDA